MMAFGQHPDLSTRLAANEDEPERQAAPASPSNSWSSTETLPAPTQQPHGAAEEPPAPARPKRCKISREQLEVLVKSFEEEPLPNFDQRQAMAKHLGMTPRSVQIWFQNRRQRLKPTPKPAADGLQQGSASHQHHSQHYGMPGLAAAAGLFGAGYPHGSPQLPLQGANGAVGLPLMQMGDVMEPFAATKALLGAGYQPQHSMLNLGHRYPHGAAGGDAGQPQGVGGVPEVSQTPSTAHACAPGASASSCGAARRGATMSAAADAAAPAADGLLLLLACAGSKVDSERSDAATAAAPSAD